MSSKLKKTIPILLLPCPRNVTQSDPKRSPNAAVGVSFFPRTQLLMFPFCPLDALTVLGFLISPKWCPQGAPKGPIWGPKADQKRDKIHKNYQKYHLESTPGKDHEKVPNWDPPGPQKVCFRARGPSISTNPTSSPKDTKISPKRRPK